MEIVTIILIWSAVGFVIGCRIERERCLRGAINRRVYASRR
jgi:hypothetical protein